MNQLNFLNTQAQKALDAVYGYGLCSAGFGYEAMNGSIKFGLKAKENGGDLEQIASAVHEGWAHVAKTFEDPVYASKPEKRQARLVLANTSYLDLPEVEKEKDRVIARVLTT